MANLDPTLGRGLDRGGVDHAFCDSYKPICGGFIAGGRLFSALARERLRKALSMVFSGVGGSLLSGSGELVFSCFIGSFRHSSKERFHIISLFFAAFLFQKYQSFRLLVK